MVQSDGSRKRRPVVLLRELPGYDDFLVCGISTQLHQTIPGFDEVIRPTPANALKLASVLRLTNLVAIPQTDIARVIGAIPATLHADLLRRLADHLTTSTP
ncbi:MAG: type II toxin-antitoxin system PemK/MazF family toxin [Rudanella sp.]|nr:type II toxin-antitoxin system PemK/MazF family toxin [Rudanella sp.]